MDAMHTSQHLPKVISTKRYLPSTRPELFQQWHPHKNGSLSPCEVTAGSSKRVHWLCTVNPSHEWEARVDR